MLKQTFDNVEILNYFNPELQLKSIEFAIKSKPKHLLTIERF